MKQYTVAILGATGAVGTQMIQCLAEQDFPVGELRLLASARSAGKKVETPFGEVTIAEAGPDAFAGCDSSTSLVLGSFFTLVFTFLLYIPRKVLTFGQFCEAFTEGFRSMVPAILILTLAWTLSGVCSEEYLNIGGYVSSVVGENTMMTMQKGSRA